MPPKRPSTKNTKPTITKASKSTSSKAAKPISQATSSSTVPDQAAEDGPAYFWREYGSEFSYMSQWYRSPFTSDDNKDIVYQDAEQYMMYQKAVLFNDPDTGTLILQETSPKEIKALGRKVQNFDDKIWMANRERIVEEGTYYKFKNGRPAGEDMDGEEGEAGGLWKRLAETGDRELVEASPRDRIWGIGFGEKNAGGNRGKWGLNLLGKALMKVRDRMREEESAKHA